MADYKIFWGEAHDNTYEVDRQDPPFDRICQLASRHLDFYAAAYYTSCADAFRPGGRLSELSGPQRPAGVVESETAPAPGETGLRCD